jgi:chemotaxis protein histidine kinase CheA
MAGGDYSDPAMMDLFRAELDTHLPVLGEGLLALEKDTNQPRLLEAMMRAAHSIKGAARIVGVEQAVRVAHVMEDCLVAAQKGEIRLGADAIDVLLRGSDFLTRLSQTAGTAEAADEQSLLQLVQAIAGVRERRAQPSPTEEAPPAGASTNAESALCPENLDRERSEVLLRELLGRREQDARHYRFDFSGVHEVDPSGLAMLALFARLPCRDGSMPELQVLDATPEVRELFRLTRLDTSYAFPPEQEG